MRQASTVACWRWRDPQGTLRGLARPGITILLGALALMLSVAGCSSASARRQPTPRAALPPTATATPITVLPAFSDWRAAYMGGDGRMHAVALDGTNDVAGLVLPGMDSYGLNFASAGVAPNGHLVAYIANAGLSMLDVSGHTSFEGDPTFAIAYQMSWSPNGSELALSDGKGSVWLAQPSRVSSTQHPQAVPGTPSQDIGVLLGWTDSAHVAVTLAPVGDSITLGDLDVTSGQVRPVATISSPDLSTYHFSLSPDGAEALFFNERYRDQPYTPLVDLINIATGAITPLPTLAQVMGPYSGFTSIAWRPGSSMVAASTGFKENGDLKGWLLDVHADGASPLPSGFYAESWAPSSSTLVMSTGEQFEVGYGPFELDAVTVDASGHYTSTVLTHSAMSFPFIGFVRTA